MRGHLQVGWVWVEVECHRINFYYHRLRILSTWYSDLNVYQIKKLGGEMEKMKQVKYFMSDKKANKWLKENQDKKIIDIQYSAWAFAIIYEE